MKNSFYSNYSLFGRLFRIKSLGFIIALGFILISFTLKSQNQTKEYYQTKLKSNTTVGYLSYLPPAYKNGGDFPLMIFLHGMGETGNDLDDLIYYGPPKLIHWGNWPSDRPLVVISPQNPSAFGNSWTPALVDEVIDQVVAKYNIDESRIYVTGTSMGGNGTWNYVSNYPERVAATVPICGWGTPSLACEMKNVPTWAFHNSGDPTVNVSGTTNMIDALEKCSPSPWPKETIYPKSGHDAWSMTYDLSAGHDIYSWMLSFSKKGSTPTNKNPSANAGSDKFLTLPQNSVSLTGNGSDSDGSIASYAWSKVSGPSVTMSNASTTTLNLSNLVEGSYNFRLTVKDNAGASTYDEAKVEVKAAVPPSVDGQGLNYSYYEGTWNTLPNFASLSPRKTGTVANFSLSPKLRNDHYSFQFDGFIEITTAGNYKFYTSSDDGSKLYINSKEVVNNDGLHGMVERSGSIYLGAGKHQIKGTYFEKAGGDNLEVKYSGPGVSKQTIPNNKLFAVGDVTSKPEPVESGSGLQYKYYEGDWTALPNFANLTPKKTGSVNNFSLSPKIETNNYAFQFDGFIDIATAGTYNFYTSSDDGSKLYIGTKEVVNNDGLHGKSEKSGSVYLSAGKHQIKVTYFERWSDDILEVRYSGPGISKKIIPDNVLSSTNGESSKPSSPSISSGLQYSYYEGDWTSLPNFTSLAAKKKGSISNFSLSPKIQTNNYAFQFDGLIDIKASGTYNFYTSSDDGSKLYINDQQIVDNNGLHGKRERSGSIYLNAGKHKIKVTYFERWSDDILEVSYSGPGVSKQRIPDIVLSHSAESSTTSSEINLANSTAKIAKQTEDIIAEELLESSVYPNPFDQEFTITLPSTLTGEVAVTLRDLTGKTIFTQNKSIDNFNNQLLIAVGNIPSGVYILQITSGQYKEVKRIIKK